MPSPFLLVFLLGRSVTTTVVVTALHRRRRDCDRKLYHKLFGWKSVERVLFFLVGPGHRLFLLFVPALEFLLFFFLGQFLGIHQFQHQFQVLIPSSTFHGVVISSFAGCVIGGVVVTVCCLVVAMMIGGGVGYGCILVIVVPWGLACRLFRWLALNTASLSHDTDTTSSSIPSRNSCTVRDTVPIVTHKWNQWG